MNVKKMVSTRHQRSGFSWFHHVTGKHEAWLVGDAHEKDAFTSSAVTSVLGLCGHVLPIRGVYSRSHVFSSPEEYNAEDNIGDGTGHEAHGNKYNSRKADACDNGHVREWLQESKEGLREAKQPDSECYVNESKCNEGNDQQRTDQRLEPTDEKD